MEVFIFGVVLFRDFKCFPIFSKFVKIRIQKIVKFEQSQTRIEKW